MNLDRPVQNADDYRLLKEHMTEGFAIAQMVFNKQGQPVDYVILEINPAYEQQSGLASEQVLGKRVTEFLPVVEPEWFERYGGVVLTGKPAEFELFSAPLGRWFDVRAFSLGTDNKFGILFTDCTDAKKLEEAKRRQEAEEALRQKAQERRKMEEEILELIDGFSEGTWIVDCRAGTILCSDKWAKRIGLDRVPEEERLEYTRTLAHPEDTAGGNSIPHCMETGAERFDLEYRVKTVDSGYVWMQHRGKIVYDAQGPVKVYAASIDITERKRTEKILRESEQQLRLATKAAGMYTWELEIGTGNIRFSGDVKGVIGFSYTEEDDVFSRISRYTVPEDAALHSEALKRTMRGEGDLHSINRVINPETGEIVWMETYATLVRAEDGKPLRVVGVACNITKRKRAEEAKERLTALMDNNPSLVFLKDEEGRYVYLNKTYEMNFIHNDNWYGKTDFDFWPKESAELFRANDSNVLNSGQTMQFMEDSTDMQGKRYCWLNYKFLFTDSNDRKYVGGIGIDATRLIIAEEALRESEEKYLLINTLAPFAICLMKYPELIIEQANVAYERMFGLDCGEAIGKTPDELGISLDPAGRAGMFSEVLKHGSVHTWELEYATRSGEKHTGGFSFNLFMIGGQRYMLGTGIDITEKKNAEKALRQSEEKYRTLFDNAEYGFALIEPLLDENGRVKDLHYVEINPAFERETGLKIADFLGRRLKEILPETEPRFLKEFDKTFRMGKTMRFEGCNKDTGHWYEQVVFPYANGLLGEQFINITERKCAEEMLRLSEKRALALVAELEEADRNKNEFISVLSHELRNPLAAIVAGLSVLDLQQGGEKNEEVRQIIKRQTGQLCKLVDDLLDLTRISKNKFTLKQETVLLNELITGATKDMKPQYEKKGVLLFESIPAEPVTLYADPVRISQSIGNLLNNALKYTPKNGSVWISLEAEGNEAVIRVRDNGTGIEPEILEDLFTPFVQADQFMHREASSGLGLGLAITKSIAELHGGSVTAQSEGVGKGALFTVRLPMTAEPEQLAAQSEAHADRAKPRRVLIIEDNRDLAELLREMLAVLGHQACAVYDGREGLKMAEELRPDLILCDIGLPGLNGYEIARAVKQNRELGSVYLVALTGFAGEDYAKEARKSGFDAHVAKPVTLAALDRLLAQAE